MVHRRGEGSEVVAPARDEAGRLTGVPPLEGSKQSVVVLSATIVVLSVTVVVYECVRAYVRERMRECVCVCEYFACVYIFVYAFVHAHVRVYVCACLCIYDWTSAHVAPYAAPLPSICAPKEIRWCYRCLA